MKPLAHYAGKLVKRLNGAGEVEKLCPVCQAWLVQNEANFYFTASRGAYQSQCKVCQLAQLKAVTGFKRKSYYEPSISKESHNGLSYLSNR